MSAEVEVRADVKVVPAKRTASYAIPVDEAKAHDVTADVRSKYVALRGGLPDYRPFSFPRTLAATDAMIALLTAVRAEIELQGVTE